ncbi:hypothetical protein Bxe_A2449 [Paraburkholderia xenovorans LB400]|uniref:Uncharacterized protein n=1 Tax=Paraburkholderia xenovorans (strain LB400) TaxID=266265 RepID=Q13ZG5_PARXL|nr:hypothetical protein Bxe_A2449 [Paraburkholderia xenovorans LB400]
MFVPKRTPLLSRFFAANVSQEYVKVIAKACDSIQVEIVIHISQLSMRNALGWLQGCICLDDLEDANLSTASDEFGAEPPEVIAPPVKMLNVKYQKPHRLAESSISIHFRGCDLDHQIGAVKEIRNL